MIITYFKSEGFEKFKNTCFQIFRSELPKVFLCAPKSDRFRRISQLVQDHNDEDFFLIHIELVSEEFAELQDVIEYLRRHIPHVNKKPLGCIISNFELLVKEKKYRLIRQLVELEEADPRYRFLFFSEVDITAPDIANQFDKPSVFSNVEYFTLYEVLDRKLFVKYLEHKWNIYFNSILKKKVIVQCGGYLWLIKQALRYVYEHKITDDKKIWKSDEILIPLEIIFSSFSDTEKEVIKKIILKKKITESKELHSLSHLKKLKMICGSSLSVPLLERYIRTLSLEHDVKVTQRSIEVNGVVIDGYLSPKEKKAFRILVERKNEIVSRDIVAKAIWPIDTEEYYSDWAVDRIIARLREKIKSLGMPKEYIKTVRGNGYMFSQN